MSIAQTLRAITRADGGDGLLDERAAAALLGSLLACCLKAAGYTDDFNQSKAIVAVRTHAMAAA